MINYLKNALIFSAFLLFTLLIGCTSSVRYIRPSSNSNTTKHIRPSKVISTNISKKNNTDNTKNNQVYQKNSSYDFKGIVNSYIGIPYKYGGVTRKGLDCSGLVYRVFRDLGNENIVRTSSKILFTMGVRVKRNALKNGDLVFFRKGSKINHVGIYMGSGVFVHASSSKGVMYTKLSSEYFRKRYAGSRRVYKCQ